MRFETMFQVRSFDARTLSWWYHQREDIDLNPPYQRRSGVWRSEDKAYLIDSILNDYDIPKIYIADFTLINTPLNSKNKSYAVIDGKQRFEAIFDFFDGRLALNQNFKLANDPSLKLGGLGYKDLKSQYPKISSKFENFNLSVMSVITDEEDKINELFIRLNRISKPLTGAEVRGAMPGPIPPMIDRLAKHEFFRSRIRFNIKRKQDYNVAAKLLLIEYHGGFTDTKRIHLDKFVEDNSGPDARDFQIHAERVKEILDDMADAFIERDTLLISSGKITVYYWLFRSYSEECKTRIREFLLRFEQDRKENRSSSEPDEELLNYDISIRNPNDQKGMSRSYAILQKRFKEFLRSS